jgi:hypothetical protein
MDPRSAKMPFTGPTMYFNTVAVTDFAELVSKYPADEFASPCRSTVPLLSLVKDQTGTIEENTG